MKVPEPEALFHYTCAHSRAGIEADGSVLPLASLPGMDKKLALIPPWGHVAWFTDLTTPDPAGLGLTSQSLHCDRTEHRFRVTDRSGLVWWPQVRRTFAQMQALEDAPGALPVHWWLSFGATPVVRQALIP